MSDYSLRWTGTWFWGFTPRRNARKDVKIVSCGIIQCQLAKARQSNGDRSRSPPLSFWRAELPECYRLIQTVLKALNENQLAEI